jgi:hypothetical protein
MLDILFSDIGILSAFTIIFIIVALGFGYYKLIQLSKNPSLPLIVKDDSK